MKKLFLALLFTILVLPSITVQADDVGVTAEPSFGLQPPSNFTLTIVEENQILAEWTAGDLCVNYELRRSVETHPTDHTEGEQVYYGSNLSFLDTGLDIGLEIDKYTYYYTLWGRDSGDNWSTYVTADTGGSMTTAILLGVFAFLALGLTIGGYALHRGSLAFAGAGVWGILMVFSLTQSGDIYTGTFWISMGLMLASAVEAVLLNKGAEQAEDEIEHTLAIDEAFKEMDDVNVARKTRRQTRR